MRKITHSKQSRWTVARRATTCAAIFILCIGTVSAQSTPEAAVLNYLEVVSSEGFSEVAALIHPDALVFLKETLMPIMLDPGSPAFEHLFLGDVFGPGTTREAVSKMTPHDFVRAVLIYASIGVPVGFTMKADVVGVVNEGDLRHVLLRVGPDKQAAGVNHMEVVTVKQYESNWMIMPSGEFQGISRLLRDDAAQYRRNIR
jgi:hypothetical protein